MISNRRELFCQKKLEKN